MLKTLRTWTVLVLALAFAGGVFAQMAPGFVDADGDLMADIPTDPSE